MKTMFVCLFVLCFASVTSSFAQRAMVKNDTAYYDNQKFYKGQRISLTYGSSADKIIRVHVFWKWLFGT